MSHLRLLGTLTKSRTLTNSFPSGSVATTTTIVSAGQLARLDSIDAFQTRNDARQSPTNLRSIRQISSGRRRFGSRYEPPYLDEITYEPRYETVQLSLEGHDFPILERYRKLAVLFAPKFTIEVEDSYPIPTRQTKISHFDPKESGKEGAKVIEEFVLNTFERVIMLRDVDAKAFPLFIEFLRNHQPEGVTLSARLPDPELEHFRYVPDMEMTVLQRKLEDFDSGKIDSETWKR